MKKANVWWLSPVICLAMVAGLLPAHGSVGTTTRVSVATGGAEGNAGSSGAHLSSDGRLVAFESWASNLVAGDTNDTIDVFVRDRATGVTSRVSVSTGGAQGNGASYSPQISANGRFVAFASSASNLVNGDTNDSTDIFVHDLSTGATQLVTRSLAGQPADSNSYEPSISGDGRYVSFMSYATNLVPGGTSLGQVYVHDRTTGVTALVSKTQGSAAGNGVSLSSAISPNGRYIAFASEATNLVPDANGWSQILVHDRNTGGTTLVSKGHDGVANGPSASPSISNNGRYVAFASAATNLSPQHVGLAGVFVHDRIGGMTRLISVTSDGTSFGGHSFNPVISGDGTVVAFDSTQPLDGPSTLMNRNVFVHSLTTATTTRVSVGLGSADADGNSFAQGVSFDGRFVSFSSSATNLVSGDTNNESDIFVHQHLPNAPHESMVGFFDPLIGQWKLRQPDGSVNTFYFGNPGDYPFMGDWNCDGIDTPGLYRQSDGYVYLRNTNSQGVAHVSFYFGNPGDIPIAGDFNHDGCDTVSIYRPSQQTFYIINKLGENGGGLGAADFSFLFGNPGDKPFSGDFDNDGVDTIGLHRESTGRIYYRNTLTTGSAHNDFIYGNPEDYILSNAWTGVDGPDTVAVWRPSQQTFYFRFSNSAGAADAQLVWGQAHLVPVSGSWVNQ